MEDNNQEVKLHEEIMTIFHNTEIYHGCLENNSIVYKATYDNQALYFLLYDYESVYYTKQHNNEIFSLNKSLNASLEFNQLSSLVTFIVDNLIKAEEKLIITKQKVCDLIMFAYETVIDILNVKWLFSCKKINNCNQLAQNLFIKPMNNIIISFGYLINLGQEIILVGKGSNSAVNVNDVITLINNAYINNNRGFSKLMGLLTKESTRKVNEAKYGKKNEKEEQLKYKSELNADNKKRNKEYKPSIGAQYIEEKQQSSKDKDIDIQVQDKKDKKSKKKKKLQFI